MIPCYQYRYAPTDTDTDTDTNIPNIPNTEPITDTGFIPISFISIPIPGIGTWYRYRYRYKYRYRLNSITDTNYQIFNHINTGYQILTDTDTYTDYTDTDMVNINTD